MAKAQAKLKKTSGLITSFALIILCQQNSSLAQSQCSASECRMNQSTGTSSSVGVGVTSTFGVNSSAQSSPNYNTSSSASLVLNAFNSNTASDTGYNTSIQAIGSKASDAPINIKITSETIQTKNKDGKTTEEYTDAKQQTTSDKFMENGSSASNADFSAEGFGAMQDLRFKGTSDSDNGSQFKTEVLPVITLDEQGNQKVVTGYSTGNASANAQTATRFQADITTSNFVNAFMSSF